MYMDDDMYSTVKLTTYCKQHTGQEGFRRNKRY